MVSISYSVILLTLCFLVFVYHIAQIIAEWKVKKLALAQGYIQKCELIPETGDTDRRYEVIWVKP